MDAFVIMSAFLQQGEVATLTEQVSKPCRAVKFTVPPANPALANGPNHPAVAKARNNRATLYDQQGRYAADERLYGRSLAIADKTLVPTMREGAPSLNNLADFSVVGEGGHGTMPVTGPS
jgi:hypothetical protein